MAKVNGDSITPTLNMLNAKYFMFGKEANQVIENPYANGNAWFVSDLKFVKNADEEMAGLDHLDTKHAAVADQRFKAVLDGTPLGEGKAEIVGYQPNELKYDVSSDKGGVLVFSEIYYPGWTATIDGKPAEIGRVNYVLRAMKVPAGKHEITLTFRPSTVTSTNTVAYIAIALIFVLLALSVWRKSKGKDEKAEGIEKA